MIAVLRQKLIRLICDEEGVALVVTLALFMFLYISCAAVFAIGSAVKDKIALQNAVDAAAYSAAIVEADTLSKIATINRAMAYTYVKLVQLRMDYVTREWLKVVCNRYNTSGTIRSAIRSESHVGKVTLNTGDDVQFPTISDVWKTTEDAKGLEGEISEQYGILVEMNNAVADLRDNLRNEVSNVVTKILKANLPDALGDKCFLKFKFQDPKNQWMLSQQDEEKFLNQAKLPKDYATILDENFNDLWFGTSDVGEGILREYHPAVNQLIANWYWKSNEWDSWHHGNFDAAEYGHSFDPPGALSAKPLKLAESYFADGNGVARGAITVAVAMLQQNPWEKLIKRHEGRAGFYDAFSPHKETNWVYAVASAQAAYRPFRAGDGKDYSLDWKSFGNDNLRTDDWDAVFVPVSRAFSSVGGADDFKTFITSGGWEKVSESPDSDLPDYEVTNDNPLPRMHNSGGTLKELDWNELLKKIYH